MSGSRERRQPRLGPGRRGGWVGRPAESSARRRMATRSVGIHVPSRRVCTVRGNHPALGTPAFQRGEERSRGPSSQRLRKRTGEESKELKFQGRSVSYPQYPLSFLPLELNFYQGIYITTWNYDCIAKLLLQLNIAL